MIFLLLAANFQSIRLSLAIILTIPAALCGVLLMLRLTGTTLNIQSFMGAIMAIGIAVANSILLVSFAERFRHEGKPLLEAAQEGASSRLRAILMTAAAMIFGMLPMAIGMGEGGVAIRAAGPGGDRRADRIDVRDAHDSAVDLRNPASGERPLPPLRSTRWIPRADTMTRNKTLLAFDDLCFSTCAARLAASRRTGSCGFRSRYREWPICRANFCRS